MPQAPEAQPWKASALEDALPPFEMAPAPPLMRRWTAPPQRGQAAMGASDIFWRWSKWWPQLLQWYSYAGMTIFPDPEAPRSASGF